MGDVTHSVLDLAEWDSCDSSFYSRHPLQHLPPSWIKGNNKRNTLPLCISVSPQFKITFPEQWPCSKLYKIEMCNIQSEAMETQTMVRENISEACCTVSLTNLYASVCVAQSRLTLCDPHGLHCPWNFLGKNTGVGCHFLLQRIFPTQRLKLHLLRLLQWQTDPLLLRHLGSLRHPLRMQRL